MNQKSDTQDLQTLRTRIDVLDDRLIELLRERVALVLQVEGWKFAKDLEVFDPGREEQILLRTAKLASQEPEPLDESSAREFMGAVLGVCRSIAQKARKERSQRD